MKERVAPSLPTSRAHRPPNTNSPRSLSRVRVRTICALCLRNAKVLQSYGETHSGSAHFRCPLCVIDRLEAAPARRAAASVSHARARAGVCLRVTRALSAEPHETRAGCARIFGGMRTSRVLSRPGPGRCGTCAARRGVPLSHPCAHGVYVCVYETPEPQEPRETRAVCARLLEGRVEF